MELNGQRVAVANTRWWKEGLAFLWLRENLKRTANSISLDMVQRPLSMYKSIPLQLRIYRGFLRP